MKGTKCLFGLFFVIVICLGACQFSALPATETPTELPSPVPTETLRPTATHTATAIVTETFAPTATRTVAPTQEPAATITLEEEGVCTIDGTIQRIQQLYPNTEINIGMDKVPSLDINKLWIIKVEKYLINSDAETDDDINYYNGIAFQEAFQTARNVVTLEPCVDELFDQINATILDKNHNGWISVEWKLSELPRDEYLSQEEWGEMYSNLEFIYLRTKPTLKYMNPPIGACTWEEIRNNVHQHLSGEISKPSASIYLFIDEQVTVWANWQVDATEEPLEPSIPSTLMNLVHEMECLYPPPDLINFNVSDLEHNIVYYGVCQRPDDGDWPDSIVLDYYRVND